MNLKQILSLGESIMGADITTAIKAQALASAIQALTGARPIVTDHGTYRKISFTPSDQILIRSWIRSQLARTGRPDVQIDAVPILLPIALEKGWPVLAGLLGLGFLIGKLWH